MQLTDDALERVLHFLVWREADYQTCLEVTAKVSQQWARVSQLTRLRHSLTLYVDDQSKAADLVNLLGSGRHRLQARISYLLSQIYVGTLHLSSGLEETVFNTLSGNVCPNISLLQI